MAHGPSHRLGLLGALVALLAVAAPAQATMTTSRDRGGVSVPGLSAAERRALDIDTITARGGPWGVIVRARFKGDVRALGRGGLRSGIVAMVLRPRAGGARPAALATRGPLNRLDTLRRTSSSQVEIVRDGREIAFMVLGSGLARVGRVEVRAFAAVPRARARSAVRRSLSDAELNALLARDPADRGSVAAPATTDPDLCRLLREDARLYARQEEDRTNERIDAIQRGQTARLDELNRIIPQVKGARSRLRPVLGRNRCFSISAAFGYEHFNGFTRICGDFSYDLPVALFQPGAYRLFRLNEASGVFEEVRGAFFAGGITSFTNVQVSFRIDQYGTYKVVFRDRDLVGAVEYLITVPPPPPQETRDCG